MSRKSGRTRKVVNYSVFAEGSDDDFDVNDSKSNSSTQNSKKQKEKVVKVDNDFRPSFEKSSDSSDFSEHDSDCEDVKPVKKRKSVEKINNNGVSERLSESKRKKKTTNNNRVSKENKSPSISIPSNHVNVMKDTAPVTEKRANFQHDKDTFTLEATTVCENLENGKKIKTQIHSPKINKNEGKDKSSPVSTSPILHNSISTNVTNNSPYAISSSFQSVTKVASIPRQNWTPPAMIGAHASKKTVSVSGHSPASGLRLGLSRNSKFKPLHANVKLNQS